MRDLGLSDEKVAPNIPARRLGRLEEFAALVTFLASESIASISGRSIAYDDGAPWGLLVAGPGWYRL